MSQAGPPLPVTVRSGDRDCHVEVRLPGGTTVADLARRLDQVGLLDGGDPDAGLDVDGQRVAGETAVAATSLTAGSIVSARDPGEASGDTHAGAGPRAAVEVSIVGGLLSGTTVGLPDGQHVVGRADDAAITLDSPTVSLEHAELDVRGSVVTVRDLGSHNGVVVDGALTREPTQVGTGTVIECGAAHLHVHAPHPDRRPSGWHDRATGVFNRPPRLDPPPPTERLTAPRPPETTTSTPTFGWAAVLAPLALGAVMAVVFDPRYAAFMLFSPFMAIASWYEQRRRDRRDAREQQASFDRELATFRARLAGLRSATATHLRERHADPAALVRRAAVPTVALWERRPQHDDFLRMRVGVGRVAWTPPVDGEPGDVVRDTVAAASTLDPVPVVADVRPGCTVGVAGHRSVAVAAARALLCRAAVLHGPADLEVVAVVDADRLEDWGLLRWLPHARDAAGVRVATRPGEAERAVTGVARGAPDGQPATNGTGADVRSTPATILVVDVEDLSAPAWTGVRDALGTDVAAIVVAGDVDHLPSVTTSVVRLEGREGLARVASPGSAGVVGEVDGVLVDGLAVDLAEQVARSLARYRDPEVQAATRVPDDVRLADVLEVGDVAAETVLARWAAASTTTEVLVPLGATADGSLTVDLVADGPHGLVGGTTGSGKSELLRSLVLGLAASYDATEINVVLVDYKGGSAFDVCAALPHTVGLVTDLDEHLGERALVCLEAEVRRRERLLREASASDLREYRETGEVLPRLIVVVDEFAALAGDLPDFVDALVDIAQRGRSLGVHLLLATQRPSGAVNDNIRANTNLRIALRMQDAADSTDVLDSPCAAAIPRETPGRAVARLGPGDLVTFQAARCTLPARGAGVVEVRPFQFGARTAFVEDTTDETELEQLLRAIRTAHRTAGLPEPRRPWPDPLPDAIALGDLSPPPRAGDTTDEPVAVLGLADEPARQRQVTATWRPGDGNLLIYGMPGCGTTAALRTIAVSLAAATSPADLHLYVLDFGGQDLLDLASIPHVGAAIGAHESERQERLVRLLTAEVARRRQRRPAAGRDDDHARVVLLLDGYPGFAAAFDGLHDIALRDDLHRVIADGPDVGISAVVTADRINGVPASVASVVARRLLFRLPDRYDYSAFGLSVADVPPAVYGRGVEAPGGREIQIAATGPGDVPAVAQAWDLATVPRQRRPRPVGTLPSDVTVAEVTDALRTSGDVWQVPLGLSHATLAPAHVPLAPGDHVLVTGPARSGRTTTLAAIATLLAHLADVHVVAVTPRPSVLGEHAGIERTLPDGEGLRDLLDGGGRHVVLVDDADLVEDPGGELEALLDERRPDVHVVAAGRADVLRAQYGHWTAGVRRSRKGLALRPVPETDGDLWQVALPRHGPTRFPPGRGYLVVDGVVDLVQAARPADRGAPPAAHTDSGARRGVRAATAAESLVVRRR